MNSTAERPAADAHQDKMKAKREKQEKKLADLDALRVEEELTVARKRIRFGKQKRKTAKETLQADIDAIMELEEAERELLAAYAAKYKDDPEMLRRMKAAIKASVLKQKSEGL